MDIERTSSLKVLLEDARNRGFLYYKELARFFPSADPGGTELDEVLSYLERAGIHILPDPDLVPEKVATKRIPPHRVNDFYIDADPLQVYLHEVAQVPHLTPEREIQLAETVAGGGPDAARAETQLVEANLWLVVAIARHYAIPGVHMLDLLEQGNTGLMRAAHTFRHGHGYKLATYATFFVHRSLDELVSTTRNLN